ncbi:hypothetical protein BLOT_006996 [Blomia tropicalis]|nr:hypothetical protein BLOT_006996 [Blomia tropicalis]
MSSRLLRSILIKPNLPRTDIPAYVKDKTFGKLSEKSKLEFLWQYRTAIIRQRYATFGKDSGLKAGVCWPTIEELKFKKEYEQKFEKSFQHMSNRLKLDQAKRADDMAKREKEVLKNLEKLPKQKQEFWANYHKLYADIESEKQKKERVIQEVREYLGYDIQPNDPRFEEALAKKDEEEKAAIRAARKLEKQRQNMEMLQALVSDALEKEKSESTKPVDEKEKTSN